jgi:hypothetical protein
MTYRRTSLAVALLIALCAPAPADAQIGAILEWINGLTGPAVARVGPEVALVAIDDRNKVNVAALFTVAVDDRGNPDTDAADIGSFAFQSSLESTLLGRRGSTQLRSRFGVEIHYFYGEFDGVWAPSFPVQLALHIPIEEWAVRLGTGFNVFSFADDDFAPFDIGVQSEDVDAGWMVQVEIEYGNFALFSGGRR